MGICISISDHQSLAVFKAKKKPLEVIAAESLQSIEFRPQNTVLVVEEPAVRQAGIVVDSVDQLIDGLRNKSKVI
jgi:electron transfer flavoprotein beta subunit